MKIFLSYARENLDVADRINLELREAGYEVFFDKDKIAGTEAFRQKIKEEIADCDLFLFLLSLESIEKGKYTLTEVAIARERWKTPRGRVLTVKITEIDEEKAPAFLTMNSIPRLQGDIPTAVLTEVDKFVKLHRLRWRRNVSRLALAALLLLLVAAAIVAAVHYLPRYPPRIALVGSTAAADYLRDGRLTDGWPVVYAKSGVGFSIVKATGERLQNNETLLVGMTAEKMGTADKEEGAIAEFYVGETPVIVWISEDLVRAGVESPAAEKQGDPLKITAADFVKWTNDSKVNVFVRGDGSTSRSVIDERLIADAKLIREENLLELPYKADKEWSCEKLGQGEPKWIIVGSFTHAVPLCDHKEHHSRQKAKKASLLDWEDQEITLDLYVYVPGKIVGKKLKIPAPICEFLRRMKEILEAGSKSNAVTAAVNTLEDLQENCFVAIYRRVSAPD